MAFPVTLNSVTYTLANFEGLNYVEGFPNALSDFVTEAGTKVTAAGTSATAAATSATASATSATASATSATAAAASATSAAASLDAIEGFYLGAAASDPTSDLNGATLTAGDWYFNTGSNALKVYSGSAFITFSALTFDVVDDTTPQLGGNLDFNGNTATSFASTGIDDNASALALTIDASGDVGINTTGLVDNSLSLESTRNLSWAESTNSSYANIFREASSAATVIASGYRRSETSNKMDSSIAASWSKSAVWVGHESIRFYADAASADAVGTDLTPTERMRVGSDGSVHIGSTSNFSSAQVVINRTPPTAFGSPMMQVGQEAFVGNGYYSVGLGFTGSGYTEPPAEIAAVSTSSSGGTTADIVFGTRSVTTNTAVTERMRIISTGVVQFDNGISEQYNAVTSSSNATTVDLHAGTNFSHTLSENTTFTFSNPAESGRVSSFTLKVVQDASASGYTLTWPASVDWAAATAPTLTATANAVDYFVFITHDGGTNYYGFTAGQGLG